MSLKAIKKALDALDECSRESCGRDDGCWACEERALVVTARSEVAALVNAAKTLGLHKPHESEDWDDARDLMATIAKEAE